MEIINHDIIVVGGGAAGLRAAIAIAEEAGSRLDLALVSKVYPMRSHTVSAEGGAAAVLHEGGEDSLDLHAYDTIKGSDFLADQDVVEAFVQEAPGELIQLEHWGCPWSREPDGRIAVRPFGGMTVYRTAFAADKTGFHMLHALFQTSLKYTAIKRYDEWFVTRLLVNEGRVVGLTALDIRSGTMRALTAKAIIIATGGLGRIFPFTTNAAINTGDGMALAYRAGAPLKDMEFVQYHPTGLPGTGILITEAARGEGGYLYNKEGERFLSRYVPGRMELGPRDIISRAIMMEIEAGRAFDGPYGEFVHLDLRHLGEELIDSKLPFVRELTRNYVGIDPVHEPIPVRPVAHYMMGGIHTNVDAETPLPGLYSAGESACPTINGANRLGSNSLTECLVFGARAGRAAARYALEAAAVRANQVEALANDEERRIRERFLNRQDGTERIGHIREGMQRAMERGLGVYRTRQGIEEAVADLRSLRERFTHVSLDDRSAVFNTELVNALELECMLDLAQAIAGAALVREESRGAHSRRDFPERDDERFLHHSLAYYTPEGPRLSTHPVTITRWQPEERKY